MRRYKWAMTLGAEHAREDIQILQNLAESEPLYLFYIACSNIGDIIVETAALGKTLARLEDWKL